MSYKNLLLACLLSMSCETAESTLRTKPKPQVRVPQHEIVIVYVD